MSSHLNLPGRRPRIASLVYNDAANDARVLKSADSLADAGAEVEIIAVARRLAGRPAGTEDRSEHVRIRRVAEFSLESLLGRAAPLLRRTTGIGTIDPTAARRSPVASGGEPGAAPAPPAAGGPLAEPAEPATTGSDAPARTAPVGLPAHLRTGIAEAAAASWGPVSLVSYWARASARMLALRPDTVHANDANTLVPALVARVLAGSGIVYDSHELWTARNVRQDRRIAPAVEALIERIGIRASDAVITVSPSIARWLQDAYRLDRTPFLVRNVPVAGPIPRREDGRLRELAGLPPETRVIAYGGAITTARGIEETLRALPGLPADVHLVMLGFGEPSYLAALHRLACSLGVQERVHVVGPVRPHEVSAALADGDVAVVHIRPIVLSYRFALPNKLFESVRAGLPVVAADLPDLSAAVAELGAGVSVDGEDPAALGAALLQVLESPETYRAAARAAAPGLTWERESEQLISAHSLALSRARRGRTARSRRCVRPR